MPHSKPTVAGSQKVFKCQCLIISISV